MRTRARRLQVNEAIDYMAQQLERGSLQGIRCVPASDQTASEAAFHGIPLTSLQETPAVRTRQTNMPTDRQLSSSV